MSEIMWVINLIPDIGGRATAVFYMGCWVASMVIVSATCPRKRF